MNGQKSIQRSHSAKYRPPPLPPVDDDDHDFGMSSSLPETFVSSLRQLFSILDQTNSGHIPFVVFKRYFNTSSSAIDFLNELEIESKSHDNFITFPLLIHVIQRAIYPRKPSPIVISKATRLVNRSASALVVTPKVKKRERSAYQIDFPMIRALKRFEIERDLLIQTCETLDRVKFYLNNRCIEMKEKQKSYCRCLSTAEATGIATESMYNRDFVADLLKLANTVLEEANDDSKKLTDHSSSSSSNSSLNGLNNQLKAKDDYIKRLETEKRLLLKELIEMRHEQGTVIPNKIS